MYSNGPLKLFEVCTSQVDFEEYSLRSWLKIMSELRMKWGKKTCL